jgi:hypothetical protein
MGANLYPLFGCRTSVIAAPDPISLPENRNVAWSMGSDHQSRQALTDAQPTREVGPLVLMRISGGNRFHVGMWNFVAASNNAPVASMMGDLK